MKFLVTGATGFVGSWLTRHLIKQGHDVRILQRRSSNLSEVQDLTLEHFIGDVTDKDSVMEAAKGVHSIFHLAGVVAYSRTQRSKMELVNVQGTANVLQACQTQQVTRLVHMSSVVAIGASFDKTPLNEQSEFNVSHLNLGYFETKRAAEILVKNAVKKGLIDAVILNPSTIYGPGDAKKGSRKVQLKVARGKFPFYTSGGVNIIAIEDAISGIYAGWEKGRSGERYILAGENISIKKLFHMIAEEAGVKPPHIYLPNPIVKAIGGWGEILERYERKGPLNMENAWTSILYHWFDSTKAQQELGLRPKPARHAISRSIQWSKEHGLIP